VLFRAKGIPFGYLHTTANANMRVHLANKHMDILREKGWVHLLPKNKRPANEQQPMNTRPAGTRPEFSQKAFLDHLVNFIVADDQVRHSKIYTPMPTLSQALNIVECPKFRALLLLRQEMQDENIPHRTKIWQSIIQAWKVWFQALKKELEVSCVHCLY
jgi:hypothetical protein